MGGSRERKATRSRRAQSRSSAGGRDDLPIPESAEEAADDPSLERDGRRDPPHSEKVVAACSDVRSSWICALSRTLVDR